MDRVFKLFLSVTVILLIVFSVCTKGLMIFFDYFTQTPLSTLTFFNYLLPALLTLTIAITAIIHFCRVLFFPRQLLEIPKWADNKISRGLLFSLVIYTIIWQTNYFFWLMKKRETIVIIADTICILCSIFITIILLKHHRTNIKHD